MLYNLLYKVFSRAKGQYIEYRYTSFINLIVTNIHLAKPLLNVGFKNVKKFCVHILLLFTLLTEIMGNKVNNGGKYVGKGLRGYSEEEVREVLV